ncbi:MAG: hypothetical protein WCO19_04600 [Candidatus Saccharibacteria bacterium]
MKRIKANFDVISESGEAIPTEGSINSLLKKLDQFGVAREELLFSGHKMLTTDMASVDARKLADTSLEEDGSREFLNTREIETSNFRSRIDMSYSDPSKKLLALRLEATEHYNNGDMDLVEDVKEKIRRLQANSGDHEAKLAERKRLEADFELSNVNKIHRPVYFCGDVVSMTMASPEDNPVSYAFLPSKDSTKGNGFLSVYSKPELQNAGAEIHYLDDVSDRSDHQVLVYAEHTVMTAGKIALVQCNFEFIG